MKRKAAVAAIILAAALMMPQAVFASQKDIDAVNEMIEQLPEGDSLTEEDADEVMAAMEAYRGLTMADRLYVEGTAKLEKDYQALVKAGVVESGNGTADANRQRDTYEREKLQESDVSVSGATSYVFAMDSGSSLSIVMRFTSDTDGDGKGNVPDRIVLTSPDGTPTPITKSMASLKDDTMNIAISWEQNFVQFDVASAAEGNWEFNTSTPVTFSRMPFLGSQEEIHSVDEQPDPTVEKQDQEPEEIEGEDPEEEKKGFPVRNVFLVILLLALVAGIVALLRRSLSKDSGENDEGEGNGKKLRPKKISKEDEEAAMRRVIGADDDFEGEGPDEEDKGDGYSPLNREKPEHDGYDDDDGEEDETAEATGKGSSWMGDDDEDGDDDADDEDDMPEQHIEGETGILKKAGGKDPDGEQESGSSDSFFGGF